MEGAEDFYAASAEGLGELLSQLAQAIGYAGSVGSFASYAPGSAQSRPWAGGLAAAAEASLGFSSARFEAAHTAYTAAADRMQNRFEELLDKRADHGAADMLVGGVTVLLGGLTIALTGSAAIPFVVPMMAFGSAQFVEGSQNLVYGSSRDLGSTAWNPIRDTVFLGNQDWYNFGYGVAELSAAWGAPFQSAFTAAKATGLSGLKAAPTFVKSFAEGAAKDVAYDAGADFAFTTIVDPQIDKYFAGTEMGSALKEVSRDVFEQVTSMPGDVVDPGKKTSGSVHAGVPKAGLPLKDGPYIKDGKPNGRPKLSGAKKLEFERAVSIVRLVPMAFCGIPIPARKSNGNPARNDKAFAILGTQRLSTVNCLIGIGWGKFPWISSKRTNSIRTISRLKHPLLIEVTSMNEGQFMPVPVIDVSYCREQRNL